MRVNESITTELTFSILNDQKCVEKNPTGNEHVTPDFFFFFRLTVSSN